MGDKSYTSYAAAPAALRTENLRDMIAVSRMYPQLHLHVWAQTDGVHCDAYLAPADTSLTLKGTQVIQAVWQPSEVTEQLVVEWAYRALRKLLQDEYEGTGHM